MRQPLSNTHLEWIGRLALFIIFFWFGSLKIISVSPAGELVDALREATIPFFSMDYFFPAFGLFEAFIGCLFLIPKASRLVIIILFVHMAMTFLPLVLLPELSWSQIFVPTLIGQYIIKNIALVALALIVTAMHRRGTRKISSPLS